MLGSSATFGQGDSCTSAEKASECHAAAWVGRGASRIDPVEVPSEHARGLRHKRQLAGAAKESLGDREVGPEIPLAY